MTSITHSKIGKLALECCNVRLPIQVLQSNAGYYIGTFDEEGPCSRESLEYFPTYQTANEALTLDLWTQRDEP